MKRFVQGHSRTQTFLLPEALDGLLDVFVDEFDLHNLGFEGVEPALTGWPSYHPEVMPKIYIYGYLNHIPSSRRLEREAERNVELMWLTGRLAPDFKTIARLRKDNGKAIRSVCRQLVMSCQRVDLFDKAFVAIDGSKFKTVNPSRLQLHKRQARTTHPYLQRIACRLPHGKPSLSRAAIAKLVWRSHAKR